MDFLLKEFLDTSELTPQQVLRLVNLIKKYIEPDMYNELANLKIKKYLGLIH